MRDYRKERRAYYGYGPASKVTKTQRRHRKEKSARNAARAKMKKMGKVKRGQDVHHKNGNPRDNRTSNLKATSIAKNRSNKI